MHINLTCVNIFEMNEKKTFKIDPQYKLVNRLIDTDGVNNIKAYSLKYVTYEVNRL